MPDDAPADRLSLRQADQARANLEFLRTQLARLPTRKDIARLALLVVTGGAALAVLGIELLSRG
jgi:hypothetical protein